MGQNTSTYFSGNRVNQDLRATVQLAPSTNIHGVYQTPFNQLVKNSCYHQFRC